LNTDNFQTTPDLGWNAGLSVRGNFMKTGTWFMHCSSVKIISVATRKLNIQNVDVNYKLASAQVSLQLSYVSSGKSFELEFGPIVQNGNLKLI
jgi:hypothetical protein